MQAWLNRMLIPIVVIAGLTWTWVSRPNANSGADQNTPAEAMAPPLELPMLDGRPVNLAQLRGKVVVLNFWATWCPPCRAEMAELNATHHALGDRGLMVLGVNQAQDSNTVQQFMKEQNLSFPIALDQRGEVSQRYRVIALPTTFIIDRAGHIREVIHGGALTRPLIESKVNALLSEQ